jgi:hypothetical protein
LFCLSSPKPPRPTIITSTALAIRPAPSAAGAEQQPFAIACFRDLACPPAHSHIRYKVIIRIGLSACRCRYIVPERAEVARPKGRETCPGRRRSSWKCALAWKSPATCRPKSNRSAAHNLELAIIRVWVATLRSLGRIFAQLRSPSRPLRRAGEMGLASPGRPSEKIA